MCLFYYMYLSLALEERFLLRKEKRTIIYTIKMKKNMQITPKTF